MTQGELVARVLNTLKLLNKDEHISRRHVLSIIKSKAKKEISRKMDRKTLFTEPGIFSWVKCVELERVDIVKCDIIEFRTCKKLMRSKKKLPELISHDFGTSIKMVTTLDTGLNIDYIDIAQWVRNMNRPYKIKGKEYYTIKDDNHLYLLDSDIEAVDILLASLNEDEIREMSGCGEWDECTSPWDYEIKIPPKMIDFIIQETLNEIGGITRRISEDENPNLDSNIKSQTAQ